MSLSLTSDGFFLSEGPVVEADPEDLLAQLERLGPAWSHVGSGVSIVRPLDIEVDGIRPVGGGSPCNGPVRPEDRSRHAGEAAADDVVGPALASVAGDVAQIPQWRNRMGKVRIRRERPLAARRARGGTALLASRGAGPL